ncbi:hypothetical protein DSO57_1033810 [Entomophthora muscae]|uniref:Uncharacterized protein n=1 Tax=Entomophthora muscae TaxID=34485 RepID=A0ACC2TYJ6_9FUNG|nr:hypothetical protein DSO57_1033810 [Entomophthora muscae]
MAEETWAMRLLLLLASAVSGKVVFPAECNRAGLNIMCSGPSCPPCWLTRPNGEYHCYDYTSEKICPFDAEDVSSQLATQPTKTSTTKPTPTPKPPSSPATRTSYRSTSTVIVYVTVTVDDSSPRPASNHFLLTPLLFILFL